MNSKVVSRQKIRYRIRKKISGTTVKPRLTVFRSNNEIYAQLIDDQTGTTVASASSLEKDVWLRKCTKRKRANWLVNQLPAKRLALGIKDVTFDRSGYLYHGRIKAVAEGAREGGLLF